jgi:hypothetical protein
LLSARAQEASPTATPPATSQAELNPTINTLGGGEALQGAVTIEGTTAISGFQSAYLAFRYHGAETNTWFLIAENIPPLENAQLAEWDTNTITDGDYDLELVVLLENGNAARAMVAGLRVRNYTTIETSTPIPITPSATQKPEDTPIPTLTPTPTQTPIPPTPTDLPPNPAEISKTAALRGMGKGALAVFGFFALMGIYAALRRLAAGR